MSDFEKLKEQLPSKEKFYSLLTGRKISGKEYERVLKVWDKFEMKTMKDVFEKFRNNSLKIMDCIQIIILAHQPCVGMH